MKFLHFLKNHINPNNSLIYNEDFFENQKKDSKKSAKTAEKSKSYTASAQEEKRNNKRGFLRAFKQSPNKEVQQIENKDYFLEYETIQKTVKKESAESESVAQEKKSNNKRGFLRAFRQSMNKEVQPVENNTIKLIRNTFAQPAFSACPFENKRVQLVETGRSMVEILGVMAVIGVLTVGGISGYRFAMDKYRANDIANEVNLRNRDTWAVYQTKDLPEDVFELEEWATSTQTGFPIHVYPRSNLVFDVQVYDVPPRVCKNVLQMSLQGPMFMWTTIGDDINTHHLYNGSNPEICDINDEGNVSMVFTTLLEVGPEPGLRNPEHRGCLEDDDCAGLCSDCENYLCETRCNKEQVCNPETEECVECMTRTDCGENQICTENHRCDTVKFKCDPGEFRTKNGACVACNFEADVLIAPDVKMFSDETDGKTQCKACGTDLRKGVMGTDPENTYCAYTCTKGFSYPNKSGNGCFLCNDPQTHEINGNDTDKCLACAGREASHLAFGEYYCYVPKRCEEGTEVFNSSFHTDCVACGTVTNLNTCGKCTLYSNEKTMADYNQRLNELCDACENMEMVNGVCIQKCQQNETGCTPVNGIINPDTCKRQFLQDNHNSNFKVYYCRKCSDKLSYEISSDQYSQDLCTACGRRVKNVNGKLYCQKPTITSCPTGQYATAAGNCISCVYSKEIEVEEQDGSLKDFSGCLSNCRKNSVGSYDVNGTVETKIIMKTDYAYSKSKGTITYKCADKCEDSKQFLGSDGLCYDCNTGETPAVDHTTSYNSCMRCVDSSGNQSREITTYNASMYTSPLCGLKACPTQTATGEKIFRSNIGKCVECSSESTASEDIKASEAECKKCGNQRIWLGSKCILVKLGEQGVCNAVGNGDYSGPVYTPTDGKKKFRALTGQCYGCDETTKVEIKTQWVNFYGDEQCRSCGNRHIEGNDCVHGFCEARKTFLTTLATCQSCNIEGPVEIPNNTGAHDSCEGCTSNGLEGGDKINTVMTLGDKAYCVPKCAEGEQFRNSAGECVGCLAIEDEEPEIGSDTDSDNLCRACGGAPTKIDGHWFCKKKSS